MSQIVRNKICKFIESHINTELSEDDSDIFQLGYVNSLFAIQLVRFVEEEFKIKVKNEELKIENFNCLGNITNYVNSKTRENI